jgi:light-regulated signal transduction histidine kinase (bacteriophytochrome)
MANKELEAFSYSVSHDLRDRFAASTASALRSSKITRIQRQGTARTYTRSDATVSGMIDDLLSLARVSREQMKLEQVDLSAMAAAILHEFHSREPGREVKFAIGKGIAVCADPRLMHIVLDNLFGNAWKFTAKKIDARIELGSEERDGQTVYFVRDKGAGLDMKYAGKLFGTFPRLHSTGDFPGSGVGLAIVQRLIHRQGGKVWSEAEVNQGANFFFTL